MITAYVLIQTDVGQAGQVASAAAEIDGVEQALPLAGPYDVIVRAEARSIDALGQIGRVTDPGHHWGHAHPDLLSGAPLAGEDAAAHRPDVIVEPFARGHLAAGSLCRTLDGMRFR